MKRVGTIAKHVSASLLKPTPTEGSVVDKKWEFAKLQKDGHLLIVTINRPDRLNALHGPAHEEFGEIFDSFEADPDLWVAIVTGEGRGFSAGNDLKFQAEGGRIEFDKKMQAAGKKPHASGFCGLTSRYNMTKPIIAAVNGIAMGGGFEIALACDMIVACESALFALPEPRVGLFAGAGGTLRLPRVIGMKRAMSMMLTGRRVPAQEGLELGFVNEVCKGGNAEVLALARKWADLILECGPLSIRATKESAMRGTYFSGNLEESFKLQMNLPSVVTLNKSEDFIEGPKAFAEKRPPNWKGK